MLLYTLRRIVIMIPILIMISIVVFALALAMPGDALSGQIDPSNTKPEYIEEMREQLGLNDPVHVQYGRWAAGILQWDFGRSFVHRMDVTEAIGQRLPNTILLSVLSLLLTYVLAFFMGRYAGRHPYTIGDYGIQGLNYLMLAIPSFVAAIFAIFFFSFQLGWFPATGSIGSGVTPGTMEYYLSKLKHAALPAIVLGMLTTASYTQFLRNDIIENAQKDYVRTARAKGTPENKIYNKHILRNSIIPIVTLFGFDIGSIIGGAVIIETVFTYPGIGELLITSIGRRDSAVVIAITLMLSVATLVGNLIADLLYGVIDPRIRVE
ncbi:peptide/nickel transport system permease protein [Evansella caseinilytica]|uniref:Peptide/nickel transport system permease protein n=1 Tax=Evansella caseinilytica TaxID=1503961 RepID=A0A1H3UZI4_9BACI|nr:oligopeptide ABC transporter permease [Evansella caseinilytica]SDZ67239.1 peptide/nickel transport system permease protein [Evansella caseinilytica]